MTISTPPHGAVITVALRNDHGGDEDVGTTEEKSMLASSAKRTKHWLGNFAELVNGIGMLQSLFWNRCLPPVMSLK